MQRDKKKDTGSVPEKKGVVIGFTSETTIGSKTTVTRITQKNIGNLEGNFGSFKIGPDGDFISVPDALYLDGVKVTEDEPESKAPINSGSGPTNNDDLIIVSTSDVAVENVTLSKGSLFAQGKSSSVKKTSAQLDNNATAVGEDVTQGELDAFQVFLNKLN